MAVDRFASVVAQIKFSHGTSMAKSVAKLKCWQFLEEGPRTKDGRRIGADGWIEFAPNQETLLETGIQSSENIIEALNFAEGPILCRGVMSGMIIRRAEKAIGSEHQFEWTLDCSGLLEEFSVWLLGRLFAAVSMKEEFAWEAIEAKKQEMTGKISTQAMLKIRDELFEKCQSMPRKPKMYDWACVRAIWIIGEDPIWQQASDLVDVASWAETKARKKQILVIKQFEQELLKRIRNSEWA